MKQNFFLHFLLIASLISFSQNGENPLPYIHKEPAFDTAPIFPGGTEKMMKYFEDSLRYPEPEKSKGIQGQVFMKFEVTKKGKIINVQGINGVPGGPNLMKEAIRLIQNMPAWVPAKKNGKPVQAEYTLSVPFKLNKKTNRKKQRQY